MFDDFSKFGKTFVSTYFEQLSRILGKKKKLFCPKILYTRPVHQNLFGHTYIPAQI